MPTATQAMSIEEAFEQSFQELGLGDPDETPELIQAGIDEEDVTDDAVDAADPETPVGETSDEEDADDEADDPDQDVIEIPKGARLRLPDGSEVSADQAVLLQRDYTKKTQAIAEERKLLDSEKQTLEADRNQLVNSFEEMRTWYETRQADPSAWVQEIVSEAQNPTAVIAKALFELAQSGSLDQDFIQTFGIDGGEVEKRAKTADRDGELDALKKRLDAQDQSAAQRAQIAAQAAEYQKQWDTIKEERGLAFDSADAETEAKRELLQFAMASKLTRSLEDAFDLMTVRKGRSVTPDPATPKAKPATDNKKRVRAVNANSTGGGASKRVPKPATVKDAASLALEEFLSKA